MKKSYLMAAGAMILALVCWGCSAVTYEYTSQPEASVTDTDLFSVRFVPQKDTAQFFAWFELSVTNTSGDPIEIDWNRTRYLLDKKSRGGFVWGGIDPAGIKDGQIPNDVIAPGQVFTRKISPLAKVAMAGRSDYTAGKDKPGLYSGILPAGENGIMLVIRANGELVRNTLTVTITEDKK